jgi:hypothetical protein
MGQENDMIFIQVGTLDDASTLEGIPSVELNVKHTLPWVYAVKGTEQRQAYS